MRRHRGTLRTGVVVVVALLVNVVVDAAFDVPMVVRWSIALAVVLFLTLLIEVVLRGRTAAQHANHRRSGRV